MHASTKLRKTSVQVVQYQGSLKFTMDLDLKIYLHPPVSFADTEILIIII